MQLPKTAHTSQPWRIHEIAPDFRVEDVWALPTPGGPGDFERLLALGSAFDPERSGSRLVRALWSLRWTIGGLLGWDDEEAGLGRRVRSLRERLPDDLRDGPAPPAIDALPFKPLYVTEDEYAAEIANGTMHGVLHLGWVPDGAGGHRGQLAVLVRRNGLFGAAYMAAIAPFRHLIVYPTMMEEFGRRWRAQSA